jgi:hypothetical protein
MPRIINRSSVIPNNTSGIVIQQRKPIFCGKRTDSGDMSIPAVINMGITMVKNILEKFV